MFTGLIQAVGKIRYRGKSLLVEGCNPFAPLHIGDSVAVDGVCLTAAILVPNGFEADVSEETIQRTTLGEKASTGNFVNLEPALRFSDRLGGHLVSGHVDGLGKITSIEELNHSWEIKINWQTKDFDRYVCEKASVAIDGISLTIASVDYESSLFLIAVIPHTWDNTSLKYLKIGDAVNLEADLMAKYAERILHKKSYELKNPNKNNNKITNDWLDTQGYQSNY